MKTLEQLDAEHKAKREKLEREIAIATAMPVPPKRVHDFYPRISLVTYEVPTLGEAVDIMQKFEIHPLSVGRGVFCEVKPLKLIKPSNATHVEGPYVCYVKTYTRDDRTADANLIFHSKVNDQPIKVDIKFGKDYIGHCDALAAYMTETKSSGGRSVISRKFDINTAIPRDNVISWNSCQGAVPTYAEMYYLIRDQAVERLTELASKLEI